MFGLIWTLVGSSLFSSLLRFLIDDGLRDLCQRVVCRLFFLEGLLEQRRSLGEAELIRPRPQRAVSRHLVMFDSLRCGQQSGIERRRALVFIHDLSALV